MAQPLFQTLSGVQAVSGEIIRPRSVTARGITARGGGVAEEDGESDEDDDEDDPLENDPMEDAENVPQDHSIWLGSADHRAPIVPNPFKHHQDTVPPKPPKTFPEACGL